MPSSLRRISVFALACALAACGTVRSRQHDDYVARVELLALLQTFNAELLSHDSATLTLERWCAEHHLAGDIPVAQVRIVARRLRDAEKPVPDDLRTRLDVTADEPIRYRHVQLVCGARVLSEAHNWYVPSRLTPEMNRQLDTTDEPFGKVVKSLGFQRHTIAAELLWSPLPAGWEMRAESSVSTYYVREPLTFPHAVLRHQAILHNAAGVPFSALVETYTAENLPGLGPARNYR